MTKTPLVSILMNCRNGEKYLKEAIESIISQTYQNWEIIFWDNDSRDNSRKIVLSYEDSRVKYFHTSTKSNLGEARENAFKQINGEFLSILDVDDIWMKGKLNEQLKYFEDPTVGICYSNTLFFSSRWKEVLYPNNIEMNDSSQKLITNYHISLETVMLRVAYIRQLSKSFDRDYSHISDFDLITRLSTRCKVVYCPKVLAGWRVHPESEGYTKPGRFNKERSLWIANNLSNVDFAGKRMALVVLSKLVKASNRMTSSSNYKDFPNDVLFRYSSTRNYAYVLFSYIPIVPLLIMQIKGYLYRNKWF